MKTLPIFHCTTWSAHTPEYREKTKRFFSAAAVYFLLIGIGFVYLYPILYMILVSVMPTSDLINPTVQWIPSALDFSAFSVVYKVLDYSTSLLSTLLLASVAAVFQTVSCALTGYALGRYAIPMKKFWIGLLILVFVIPADVVMIPRYMLYTQYHLVGSLLSVYLPSLLGQGLKSTLFVLIFMQGFASYPRSFDEAAELDGAGHLRVFLKIALPMSIPILVLSLLFSFVWYWNETTQISTYLNGAIKTLPVQLSLFDSTYGKMFSTAVGSEANRLNERIQMAATILTVAPLVLLYLFMQKGMIGSIENSGLAGE